MTLRWMYDASTPPATPPSWYCAAGYIGGDTPHVWTADEWEDQPAQARLPIFTRNNAPDTAEAAADDATAIYNALRALAVPKGSTVAVDTETVIYQTYLTALSGHLLSVGYPLLNYGSFSFVIKNAPTSGGRWAADWLGWTGSSFLFAEADLLGKHGIVAVQLASGTMLGKGYDASIIEGAVPLWHKAYVC